MRWEASEEKVLALVREYFPMARRTRASGAVHGDGDIGGISGVYFDVKDQSKGSGHTVRKNEWQKGAQQALRQHPPRELVIVSVNKDGEIMAHCKLDLLLLALSFTPKGEL